MTVKLPSHVQIGPMRYSIIEQELDGACGDMLYIKSRIRIHNEMSHDVRAVTLWHEIVHGILFGAGITASEHDEQHVDAVAHGIVAVLRDNPLMREFY